MNYDPATIPQADLEWILFSGTCGGNDESSMYWMYIVCGIMWVHGLWLLATGRYLKDGEEEDELS